MPISATGTSSRQQQGFTLIELVVVLTLLALFSALSLPLFNDRGDSTERRSLRRLSGTVKQLYNEATLTGEQHLLTLDLDRNQAQAFRIKKDGSNMLKQSYGQTIFLEPLQLSRVEVTDRGDFRDGQVSISIFPLGWMDNTRLWLRNQAGKSIYMAFSPLTGTAKISHAKTPSSR